MLTNYKRTDTNQSSETYSKLIGETNNHRGPHLTVLAAAVAVEQSFGFGSWSPRDALLLIRRFATVRECTHVGIDVCYLQWNAIDSVYGVAGIAA
jgi:hypothetical protein